MFRPRHPGRDPRHLSRLLLAVAIVCNSIMVVAQPPQPPRLIRADLAASAYAPSVSDGGGRPANTNSVNDPAQSLVGIWSGTWSGSSFGRNSPGQPAPTAPVGGTWVLALQAVDPARNTASGTLTWHGRDAYWTYTTAPGGSVTATPHDFIPDRTISFGGANTTLVSPAPGAGPQFRLTIDAAAGAPNPSDAFYGPWFSVELNPDTGAAVSRGIGFSTHPYNPANFDTAFSNGTVSGGKSACPVGHRIPDVALPEVTVPLVIPVKPWEIRYGQLDLDFTLVAPPQGALCEARSNAGSLEVRGRPSGGGLPFITFAHSTAAATLTTYKGSALGPLSSCVFLPVVGRRNNCLLNGPFDPNAYYARWHTEGFSTDVAVLPRKVEDRLRTGPLTFWVNLSARGLSPEAVSMESIVRGVEPYVHTTLIDRLPLIAVYTIIQDPGRVSLFVVKDASLGTGMPAQGSVVTNIPRSLYYPSETNPAVILLEPDSGSYQIIVNGVTTGDYLLSVSTTRLPDGLVASGAAGGSIVEGSSVVYNLSLTPSAEGVTQIFNPGPAPFLPLRLVMEEAGASSAQAAAVDAVLHMRDPFQLVNPHNFVARGSDRNTRVQLFVANLPMSPGEAVAVSVQAADGAGNLYSLAVEDVRLVPGVPSLTQITARLPDGLPAEILTLKVVARGQVTNPGIIRVRN